MNNDRPESLDKSQLTGALANQKTSDTRNNDGLGHRRAKDDDHSRSSISYLIQ